MTRYLLDTDVISDIVKPEPPESLLAWLEARADEDLFISSFTIAEIRRGILETPAGRRRKALETWFSGAEGPQSLFAGRILPFDERSALVCAALMAAGKVTGSPRSPLDMIIAAVAIENDCVLVTGNERDFAGLKVVNSQSAKPSRA